MWSLGMSARHPALEMLLSADAGWKQVPKTPPPPVPGQCLLVMPQCQVVPDVFVHRSQDDNISCQRIGLCPSVPGISHVTGPPFSCCSAMPLWDNPIWMCQIFPQALLLTSSCSQSLELGVDSRAQLFRERWSQKNGSSSSLRLAHTALLSGLFSSLHWEWSLSLCHV